MISLADLRPATLAVGLALLSIAASPQADAGATAPASVASDNVPCTIAELGNAATVGIYCEVDPHEKYYGTGAIVTSDGHILTSTTVVPAGSKKIQVYFATDHSRRTAEIVEIKDAIESTLLKVNARGLPFLHVSDDPPRVGERAYTFGNAHSMIRLGDKASFSTGLVSGYYHVKSDDNQSSYVGLALESDAAINPGQDGGPLLDSRGRLAGIISLSCADARWQGMAVPIGLIRKGLDAIRDGRVKLGTASPVKPPPEDTADGNPFAARARAFAASLVAIRVERKYPPERMPQLHWAAYKRTLAGWTAFDDREKERRVADFFTAETLFGANRQVRRPDDPVTGVLIAPDGYILTSTFNLDADAVFVHQRDGIRRIEYTGNARDLVDTKSGDYRRETNEVRSVTAVLKDGRTLPAKILARHAPLGIALLKIDASNLPYIDLAKLQRAPLVGETVGVQGIMMTPGGEGFTLNTGIVSAASRDRGHRFQFDARLNYGNNGGPVFDAQGRILGLATVSMSPGPTMGRLLSIPEIQRWTIAPNSGLSFAAPAEKIVAALPDLKTEKGAERISGPFLGVSPDPRFALGAQAVVGSVEKGSPAEKAGIQRGDVLIKINGQEIGAWKKLVDELGKLKPGATVQIALRRGQEVREIKATLGERP